MGTSRRTILSILCLTMPAATLTAVSAEASTHTRAHHAAKTLTSKAGHHSSHKTAQLHSHKLHAAG